MGRDLGTLQPPRHDTRRPWPAERMGNFARLVGFFALASWSWQRCSRCRTRFGNCFQTTEPASKVGQTRLHGLARRFPRRRFCLDDQDLFACLKGGDAVPDLLEGLFQHFDRLAVLFLKGEEAINLAEQLDQVDDTSHAPDGSGALQVSKHLIDAAVRPLKPGIETAKLAGERKAT